MAIQLNSLVLLILTVTSTVLQAQELVLKLESAKTEIQSDASKIQLNLTITNEGSQGVILYGFGVMEPGVKPVAKYYEGDITCATALFFERGGKSVYLMKMPSLGWTLRPLTDSLKAYYKSLEVDMESTRLILPPGSSTSRTVEVLLHKSELKKGIYSIYSIYYIGRNLKYVINTERLSEFSKLNGVSVFQGAVKSNNVQLRVR